MKKITGKFAGANGLCDIHYYIYTPEKPAAVLMLSHGMCEYVERYKEFAEFLCENEIAFAGNDHSGHGNSITDENMLGYFGQERGYINMVRDLHRTRRIMDRHFPEIPFFLLGHSMGSFLARICIAKYRDKWNGVILTGSVGGIVADAPLKKILDAMERDRGDLYRPDLIDKIFKVFNMRVENPATPVDWLSRDSVRVERFLNDPKCNFRFTVAGYRDLLNALHCSNSKAVIENTPTDIPLLFLSGSKDAVGQYGSGVNEAVKKYVKHGCDVNVRIYPEARHELLFELNRDEVIKDIYGFMVRRV